MPQIMKILNYNQLRLFQGMSTWYKSMFLRVIPQKLNQHTSDKPNHQILNEFLFKFLKIGTATSSPQVSVALHQNCIFNNQKFNKSMISIYGLMFLFGMVILILVPSWIAYYMKDGEDPEMIYKLIYMLLCSLPVALPIIYFILNPKHNTKQLSPSI